MSRCQARCSMERISLFDMGDGGSRPTPSTPSCCRAQGSELGESGLDPDCLSGTLLFPHMYLQGKESKDTFVLGRECPQIRLVRSVLGPQSGRSQNATFLDRPA